LDLGYSACAPPQIAHAALNMVTGASVMENGFVKIVINPITDD
jgi:hypothetical protein